VDEFFHRFMALDPMKSNALKSDHFCGSLCHSTVKAGPFNVSPLQHKAMVHPQSPENHPNRTIPATVKLYPLLEDKVHLVQDAGKVYHFTQLGCSENVFTGSDVFFPFK